MPHRLRIIARCLRYPMRRKLSITIANLLVILCLTVAANAQGSVMAGVGKADITPPIGTPLAGYGGRLGGPSTGVRDPCEARALVLDNGSQKVAFVSVDHLGYDHSMSMRVRTLAAEATGIPIENIFVMSSHTHAGGGSFLEAFPVLAGKYDPKIRDHYIDRAAQAIIAASKSHAARECGLRIGRSARHIAVPLRVAAQRPGQPGGRCDTR